MNFKRITVYISKHAFTLHGVDEQERPALRRDLRRAEVKTFLPGISTEECYTVLAIHKQAKFSLFFFRRRRRF
jgi:hypothetical protein